jgi:hypothetical protein
LDVSFATNQPGTPWAHLDLQVYDNDYTDVVWSTNCPLHTLDAHGCSLTQASIDAILLRLMRTYTYCQDHGLNGIGVLWGGHPAVDLRGQAGDVTMSVTAWDNYYLWLHDRISILN